MWCEESRKEMGGRHGWNRDAAGGMMMGMMGSRISKLRFRAETRKSSPSCLILMFSFSRSSVSFIRSYSHSSLPLLASLRSKGSLFQINIHTREAVSRYPQFWCFLTNFRQNLFRQRRASAENCLPSLSLSLSLIQFPTFRRFSLLLSQQNSCSLPAACNLSCADRRRRHQTS